MWKPGVISTGGNKRREQPCQYHVTQRTHRAAAIQTVSKLSDQTFQHNFLINFPVNFATFQSTLSLLQDSYHTALQGSWHKNLKSKSKKEKTIIEKKLCNFDKHDGHLKISDTMAASLRKAMCSNLHLLAHDLPAPEDQAGGGGEGGGAEEVGSCSSGGGNWVFMFRQRGPKFSSNA